MSTNAQPDLCVLIQHAGEKPPAPTRGLTKSDSTECEPTDDGDADASQEAINVQDLLPRVDIGPQLTSAIINELSDKNWKVFIAALGYLGD